MKEIPIVMTPENIKTILDGRKTMTRRLVRLPTTITFTGHRQPIPEGQRWELDTYKDDVAVFARMDEAGIVYDYVELKNPHGVEGDNLWVREGLYTPCEGVTFYCRDNECAGIEWRWQRRTLSPIHMPKEAARLWLRRTDNRPPERLQQITDDEAFAEGIVDIRYAGEERVAFPALWDSIHTKPGTRYADSPWVWPSGFERIER